MRDYTGPSKIKLTKAPYAPRNKAKKKFEYYQTIFDVNPEQLKMSRSPYSRDCSPVGRGVVGWSLER